MTRPWKEYFKLGIIHFMAYPETMKGEGPILETLTQIVRDSDFQVVELTWIKDKEVRKAVLDLLKSANLEAAYGAQPRLLSKKLNLCDLDVQAREAAIAEVKESIDEAHYLGAKRVAVLSGKDPGNERRNESKVKLIESLKEISDYAMEQKIDILLEQFDRVPYGKNCLIGPTVEAMEIIERTDCFNLGLMIDLSHLPLLEETAEQSLGLAKKYLRHVHIGNCVKKNPDHPAYGDEHPRFGIPEGENGVQELEEFLQELFKIGYLKKRETDQPIISFEVKPMKNESSDEVIANAKKTLFQAWSGLKQSLF